MLWPYVVALYLLIGVCFTRLFAGLVGELTRDNINTRGERGSMVALWPLAAILLLFHGVKATFLILGRLAGGND